jgi:hypothetical protein
MAVVGLYERMHRVFTHLSGGQRFEVNPGRLTLHDRPTEMIAAGADERSRLAAAMLLAESLHCACPEINFSGFGTLTREEEELRQLLFANRSLTDTRPTIDLPVNIFLTIATSRAHVLPHQPEQFTGYAYPLFAQLNLVLCQTQLGFVAMLKNCVYQRPGWDMEEITDAINVDRGFTLRAIKEDPVLGENRWRSDCRWLAYDGKGVNMRGVQLTLIAGPRIWLNHLGFQKPKDFRILRVFVGAVNMAHFIRDWPHDRDEAPISQRRPVGYTRHPGNTPRGQQHAANLAAGRQIAGDHQVLGA